mgnify:CR=1 FL=1
MTAALPVVAPRAGLAGWSLFAALIAMAGLQQFNEEERAVLLAVKGVGATVVARLEQLGFHSLQQLAEAETGDVVSQASAMLGSSWPQGNCSQAMGPWCTTIDTSTTSCAPSRPASRSARRVAPESCNTQAPNTRAGQGGGGEDGEVMLAPSI